ncbi:MAG: N-acetylmuramoyl-L-alanine amidase [Polyangiaceae bacterium]
MPRVALALVLVAAFASSGCRVARAKSHRIGQASATLTPPPPDPKTWPDALPEEVELPDSKALDSKARRPVVYLDPGHGARDNPGNTSSFCVEEQDFTRELMLDVTSYLEETGRFEFVTSRPGGALVSYADRVDAARRAHADVFVSFHSDIRGVHRDEWSPQPGQSCKRSFDAPGFSVLYSDEGASSLVRGRVALASSISEAMRSAGFVPYTGAEYRDLYEGTPSDAGVFVDRHEEKKRIFVLRRTEMPAVIVETHNALDPREAAAWEEPTTRRAFAFAIGRAILESFDTTAKPPRG